MKNTHTITVFGATGKIGGELLRLLSQAQIPAIAVTRDKNKAVSLPFVKWVEADMNNKESLQLPLTGSAAVFLISGASETLVQEQCNVIDAAAACGIKHIVKLSSAMADPRSPLYIAHAHGRVEEYLKASGINGTILRPTGFMQNWLGMLLHTVKTQRKIYEATGNGKRAYIDLHDIAEAAFKILTNPGAHISHAYLLTGGEAVNYEQIADIIGKAIGDLVTYVPMTIAVARQQMEQKGLPQWAIETFIAYAEDQRNHKADFVSDDVSEILGKPPRTIDAFFNGHAGLFR